MLNDRIILPQFPRNFVLYEGIILGVNGNPLSPGLTRNGYCTLNMQTIDGKWKSQLVHRIVAAAFKGLDLKDFHTQVDHDDDNPQNNHCDNLVLMTSSKNVSKSHDWRFELDTDTHKLCRQCDELKLRIFYTIDRSSRDGQDKYCKTCQSINRRK